MTATTTTRRFDLLRTWHTGVSSTGRNYREEMAMDSDDAAALALEAAEDDDLLNLVPVEAPAWEPSPAQVGFIRDLIRDIEAMDAEAGRQAKDYTVRMVGHWTGGREGNLSRWIDRLKAKRSALREATAKAPTTPAPEVEIPAGRYAVETDEIRCYTVDYGKAGTKWDGFLFLNRISSDDRFPVKNPAAKEAILAAIRADVAASELLAALTLRQCIRCGRTLSDTKNPHFHRGLGPDCGEK